MKLAINCAEKCWIADIVDKSSSNNFDFIHENKLSFYRF